MNMVEAIKRLERAELRLNHWGSWLSNGLPPFILNAVTGRTIRNMSDGLHRTADNIKDVREFIVEHVKGDWRKPRQLSSAQDTVQERMRARRNDPSHQTQFVRVEDIQKQVKDNELKWY